MAAVRELDLSACSPNSLTDRINAVPGLKTSTGTLPLSTVLVPFIHVHFKLLFAAPVSVRLSACSSSGKDFHCPTLRICETGQATSTCPTSGAALRGRRREKQGGRD
jgi:hypothetical protein